MAGLFPAGVSPASQPGLLLLAAAVAPPVDAAADERLSAHMLEHLVTGDLAPLALRARAHATPDRAAAAAPRRVARAGARAPRRGRRPLVGSLYFWHLRFAYGAAVEHALVHVLQHACVFVAGANLWFALLGPLPKPVWFGNGARLVYVLAVWVAGSMLAYGLVWSSTAFYPHYAHTAASAGRSAGADQSAAGAAMLVEQSVVIVTLLGRLLARALRDAGRREDLAELAAAHGVPLDERRSARAVAAEQHAALAAPAPGAIQSGG